MSLIWIDALTVELAEQEISFLLNKTDEFLENDVIHVEILIDSPLN